MSAAYLRGEPVPHKPTTLRCAGKIQYQSPAAAAAVATGEGRRRTGSKLKVNARPYRCEHCGAWHLTSHRPLPT